MLSKLWNDEAGVVSIEYLFLATIVGLGTVVAFSSLENAIKVEYTELANAIMGLSQAYSIAAESSCKATRGGSAVTDTAGTIAFSVFSPGVGTSVNVAVCTGASF